MSSVKINELSLINEINNIFQSDPLLDELDFLLAPPSSEDYYVIHIQHKLGLMKCILKPLFIFAIQQFHTLIEMINQQQQDDENLNLSLLFKYSNELQTLTRIILVIKGDHLMAFNYRRQLIQLADKVYTNSTNSNTIQSSPNQIITNQTNLSNSYNSNRTTAINFSNEITFLNVLFTRHPKSPSAWQYRRFCLLQLFHNTEQLSKSKTTLISEFSICSKFADVYPKNYYAWIHRLWLLDMLSYDELLDELEFTTRWLHSQLYFTLNSTCLFF